MNIALLLAVGLSIGQSGAARFHVVHEDGKDWIVRPDGRKFWSLGVCCIGPGFTPKEFDPKNPGYAAFRDYPSIPAWADDTVARLTNWGFNTVGAWSEDAELLQVRNQPDLVFTPILHIGSSAGAPWRDMWDPAVVKTMDEVARVQIQAHHGDPRVLGYFSDNEQGWWYGAMWDWAFKSGPASRGHVVDLLNRTYRGDWARLNRDFDPDGAASLGDLRKQGRLYLRPGGSGLHTVQAWMGIVSARYYDLCRSIIKKYDPGALYLGDRYISNFYPEVARSAGARCDIVSTNLNADDNLGDFAPFYLPSLHRIAARPLMITEYYVGAKENGSGNQNNSSGFPVLTTQAERAHVFGKQTATLAGTPYVVGAHWFQYFDEPKNGRGDGENYDMGLVDIDNRPYADLTAAARNAHPESRHEMEQEVGPRAASADSNRLDDVAWWLEHGMLIGGGERGNIYLAVDKGDLVLGIYWNEDRFAEAFYRDGKVPEIDRAHVIVRRGPALLADVRLGDGQPPKVTTLTNAEVATAAMPLDGVRNLATIRLPTALGRPLDATLDTRARAYVIKGHWSGEKANRG